MNFMIIPFALTRMSEALSRPNPFDITLNPLCHNAYEHCLDLEDRHLAVKQYSTALTVLAPQMMAVERCETHEEVVQCATDEEKRQCIDMKLQALAILYKDHFIRCFFSAKIRTPITTPDPSALLSQVKRQEDDSILTHAATSHSAAKAQALHRDGYRCVFTGKVDLTSFINKLVLREKGFDVATTHCAHIINDQSTDGGPDDDNNVPRLLNDASSINPSPISRHASAHAFLERFGQIDSIEELNGDKIHRLKNVLTLEPTILDCFDTLEIWLEKNPDDPDNCYRPGAIDPAILDLVPSKIQLTTPDPRQYPLPDPRYLAVHAACARVAHLSGAAGPINDSLHDIENIQNLANNGSSGDVLYHALMRRLDVDIEPY
ncbi:hypothetical protein BDZ97DRAFT_1800895 [Flammula alnicola]|nr:hypothetical protein BDZ97DRAFT_1800895 [Flammula alnicola]